MEDCKIGLAWGFGNFLTGATRPDQRLTMNYINSILKLEVGLIETADSYLSGETEKLLGAMSDQIKNVGVATKVGGYRNSLPYPLNVQLVNSRVVQKLTIIRNRGYFSFNPRILPDSLRGRLESSLKRLRRNEIDIYMLHGVPEHCRVEDFVAELINLKELGMVRNIGLALDGNLEVDTAWCDYLEITLDQYNTDRFLNKACIIRSIHRNDIDKQDQVNKIVDKGFSGYLMSGSHNLNHYKELADAVSKYR